MCTINSCQKIHQTNSIIIVSKHVFFDPFADKDSARRLSSIVEDACFLLSEYNKRLSDELEDRKKVAKMLRGFILSQRNQLVSAEKRLLVGNIQIIQRNIK